MWAFGSNMVSKITTIVAPRAMRNKYAQVIFKIGYCLFDVAIGLNIFQFFMRDKMYLIFLNFFLESGLLELPLHSVPEGPQTKVASTPLSEGLHSNSTSSPSSRLLNPDLWTTDYTRKYKLDKFQSCCI